MLEELVGAVSQFFTYGFRGVPDTPSWEDKYQFYERQRVAARQRGWSDYHTEYARRWEDGPFAQQWIWIWRPEWNSLPVQANPRAIDPQLNVIGLLWKPYRDDEPGNEDLKRLPPPTS